jgi:hypothetical protein
MRARFQPKPRTHDRNLSFQDCTIGLFTVLAPSCEHDVWPCRISTRIDRAEEARGIVGKVAAPFGGMLDSVKQTLRNVQRERERERKAYRK